MNLMKLVTCAFKTNWLRVFIEIGLEGPSFTAKN